jgi:hypothetical protein
MAKLTWRGPSAGMIGAEFIREGANTSKRGLRHMRRVSQLVMEQSIRNSPVDWKGYSSSEPPNQELEKSHKMQERYGGGGRIEATILVGGMVGETDVDLYADYIHEGMFENLGKASIAKAAADPRNKVGDRFLERALEEHENEFEGLLDELLEGLLG